MVYGFAFKLFPNVCSPRIPPSSTFVSVSTSVLYFTFIRAAIIPGFSSILTATFTVSPGAPDLFSTLIFPVGTSFTVTENVVVLFS